MADPGEGRRVRRLHYMGQRSWLILIAVLGMLLLGPVVSEFGPGGPGNRWIEAGVFVIGVVVLVGVWRFLARSFPADEVESLIPRYKEIDENLRYHRRGRTGTTDNSDADGVT